MQDKWKAKFVQHSNEPLLHQSQACSFSPFCAGMCEWTGCKGAQGVNIKPCPPSLQNEPLPSTATVSLSSETIWFNFESKSGSLSCLRNFQRILARALGGPWCFFKLWSEEWNKSRPQDPVPLDLLRMTQHYSASIFLGLQLNWERQMANHIHQSLFTSYSVD